MTEEVRKIVGRSKRGTVDLSEGLEAIRVSIALAKEDRSAIARMPVSAEEAASRAEAWVANLGKSTPLDAIASRLIQPDWREPASSDTLGVVISVLQEQIGAALLSSISSLYGKAKAGVSASDRAAAIAKHDMQILDLELSEEAIIRAAEAAGIDVLRRADADPRAVLARKEDLP